VRLSLFLSLFSLFLWGYEIGDPVDPQIASRLHLQKGTQVLLFFASWCHSCARELPQLKDFSSPGVELVGVDVDEDLRAARRFQKKLSLPFRVINDPQGEIISQFNPVAIPAIYIVSDGVVKDRIIGSHPDIRALLQERLRRIER